MLARASRAYRCDGLRLERARRWCLLRARSRVDAGSAHPHERPSHRLCSWRRLADLASKFRSVASPNRFDRRIVLALLGLGFAVTAFAMVLLPRSLPTILPAAVLLGGFMSTPALVCVAHAHDRMPWPIGSAVSGSPSSLVSGVGSDARPADRCQSHGALLKLAACL